MGARLRRDKALVIDLECTCWDTPQPPEGEVSDIIEVGLVEVDLERLIIGKSERLLVRPARSTVSQFCTDLTGITAADLKRYGRPFGEVRNRIAKEFGPTNKTLVAWGTDWETVDEACRFHKVANPFPQGNALDFGHVFGMCLGSDKAVGLGAALQRFGIGFEGRPHCGLDDAINTARLYLDFVGRQRVLMQQPGLFQRALQIAAELTDNTEGDTTAPATQEPPEGSDVSPTP